MTQAPKYAAPTFQAGRVSELDALRGLAAIAVLLYHYTSAYPRLFAHKDFAHIPQLNFGYFGVELFFMISGFVIFFSAGRSRSIRDFALSRFSRLFPVYWAAVILTTCVDLFTNPWNSRVLMGRSLVNLTMLQTFAGVGNLDASYWTLAFELSFYFLIVLAIRLTITRGVRIEWALLAWLAATTIIRGFAIHIPYRLTILTLLDYGQFFIFGMALFSFYSHAAGRLTYLTALWALLICAFGADPQTPANGLTYYFPACLACAAIMAVALWQKPPFLRSAPLQFFGRISYSLYLIHSTLGFFIIRQMTWAGQSDFAAVGCAALASIGLGWLLNITIETKARVWMAQKFDLHRPSLPDKGG